jgi:predicted PurR-regulated permease PerM
MSDEPKRAEGASPRDSLPGGGTFWSWLRKTARLWGFLAFVVIILILFRKVSLPFILGALTAYLLAPVLRFLCTLRVGRVHLPRPAWLVLLYALLLGLQVLFLTSFVPRVSKDFKRIVQEAPQFWSRVREQWVPGIAGWIADSFGEPVPGSTGPASRPALDPKPPAPAAPAPRLKLRQLPGGELEVDAQGLQLEVVQRGDSSWIVRVPQPKPKTRAPAEQRVTDAIDRFFSEALEDSESRLNQIVQVGQVALIAVLNTITTFILVLMISAFLLVDPGRILRGLRNLVPEIYFREFDEVVGLIDKGLSAAIRGQLLICVINGLLTWLGLAIFGVKYSLILALLAGTMSLIPIFGSILSSIPIIIVALVSTTAGIDLFKGGMMLAWIIGIHLIEANLLNPKIIGTAAKIHPVVVIFAVVAGERSYGPIGALLAVPIVSAVQAVFIYLRQKARASTVR